MSNLRLVNLEKIGTRRCFVTTYGAVMNAYRTTHINPFYTIYGPFTTECYIPLGNNSFLQPITQLTSDVSFVGDQTIR